MKALQRHPVDNFMLKQRLIIFISILGLFLPFSYVSAGTVLSSHTYAWSNNVGYINFANVIVDDSALSGYAWSTNKGFIKFNPAEGGVLNDGTGNLSGSAWGEQLGWIDFNNVSINSNGQFSGTATGTLVGTITFDCPNYCDVQTDWRQTISPVISSGGGGGGRAPSLIPSVPSLPDLGLTDSEQAKLMDIQKDGVINILDFNAMMANWGEAQNLAAVGSVFNSADMNKDGIVDISDFNALMVYWEIPYSLL